MPDDVFLVGCGAGFADDRLDAGAPVVRTMIQSGRPAAMIYEVLGERTLALAQRARRSDPTTGFEPRTVDYLRPVLADCVRHRLPIIGNFGAANPEGAGRAVLSLARELGIDAIRVAVIDGDDVLDRIFDLPLEIWEGEAAVDLAAVDLVAANAYVGAAPIVAALAQGADVVITGRVTDSALALAPLMRHFGWAADDWPRLAAGVLVGHLLECGSQITGGYFADPGFKDVPGMATIGFPIAEVGADGCAVITKAAGTGGLVSEATVKEQILYEVHEPFAYLVPDVTLDLGGVRIETVGPDRVAVRGARGGPPPERLKVTVSYDGGFLGEGEISYAGPNARRRAELALATVRERLRMQGIDCRQRLDLIGCCSLLGDEAGTRLQEDLARTPADGDFRLRLAVETASRREAERAIREVISLYCCGPAGGGGVRQQITPRIRTVSYLLPRSEVTPRVRILEGGIGHG